MLAAILSLGLIAGSQAHPEPAVPNDPVPNYRISVPRVELTVSVMDRRTHKPVPGLSDSDFRILDNGHPVTITHFDAPGHTRPFMVWLLFRNDTIDQKTLPRIEAEIPAALQSLPDSAWVGVASYSEADSVLWLSPQPRRDAVLAAIHNLAAANPDLVMFKKSAKKPAHEPTSQTAPDGQTAAAPAPAPAEREAVKHPLGRAMIDLGPSGGLRIVEADWARRRNSGFLPVVVLLSNEVSIDFVWSAERAKDDLLRGGLTIDELEEAHGGLSRYMSTMLRIYAPTGIPLSPGSQMYRYRYETYLANASGGEVVGIQAHNYRDGFERIFRDLSSVYALEFEPARIDGKWHHISAELLPRAGLRPSDYKVRVRQRYFAGPSASASSAQAASAHR